MLIVWVLVCWFFVETFFQIRDGLADRFRRSSAGNIFGRRRRIDVQSSGKIGLKRGRYFLQVFERQLSPDFSLALCFAQDLADDVMCLAEWNALVNEVIRSFGGQQKRIRCGGAKTILTKRGTGEGACGDMNHVADLIVCGEESFFVFLEVALVARW